MAANLLRIMVVLAALLGSASVARAQEISAQPGRALRLAIDLHKKGDFENAAQYLALAQAGQQGLTPAEQKELADFGGQNALAVKSRQEAALQLRQVEEAVQQGKTMELGLLLNQLNANQYLTAAEKQKLGELQRWAPAKTSSDGPAAKGDAKALLSEARTALQLGDFARAEALAAQAESASSLLSNWVQPWGDSPAKVRRDIQAAKAKPPAPILKSDYEPKDSSWLPGMKWFGKNEKPLAEKNPESVPADPSKPASTTSKFMGFWPFSSEKKDPAPAGQGVSSLERAQDEQMARKMVDDGFRFLELNDLGIAGKLATEAKKLNVAFAPNERTPDMLLQEIQRREMVGRGPAIPMDPNRPPVAPDAAKPVDVKGGDQHQLLREARNLLAQKKFDEADKLCTQVLNSGARWGLFADTPEKLRRDIQKTRQATEREDSFKVMAEARKLFTQGNLDEAEKNAHKAQQLHGPYGVFDFGERPAKLLEEIQRARTAKGPDDPQKKTPGNSPPDLAKKLVPPLVPASAQNALKNQAAAMVADARKMERQGQFAEAKQKALEARALRATFAPEEDSPEAVLQSLTANGDRQIQELMKQAVDIVSTGNDPQRFERAIKQLIMARQLSLDFDLDLSRVDQKAMWVQQAQASGGNMNGPPPNGANTVVATDPALTPMQQQGREKLRHAQTELTHGKYAQARKMAEALHHPMYGIQEDVLRFIRTIDAEEYNQRILEAKRTFDSGMDSFARQQYKSAANLFQSIDPQLLSEKHQARLRDVMSAREMQPGALQLVQYQPEKLKPTTMGDPQPGLIGTPLNGGESENYLERTKAMDMVRFEAMKQRGLAARRTALELFNKASQPEQAIATLKQYLEQVELEGLDSEKSITLRRPIESQIQQFQTQVANLNLNKIGQGAKYRTHDEGKRNDDIKKRQDEMLTLMKQGMELYKQGKVKESEVIARKVLDIDPENVAALAMVAQSQIRRNQKIYDDQMRENQDIFLKHGGVGLGTVPEPGQTLAFDKNVTGKRDRGEGTIWGQLKNPKERAIESRLLQPISLHLKDCKLRDVIETLKIESGVQVQPDTRALQDAGINLDAPLSVSVEKISMKSALNILLKPARLTYSIENEVLLITTEERNTTNLKRVTYPIGDLIILPENNPMPDVLNPVKQLENTIRQGQSYNPVQSGMPFSGGVPVSSFSNGTGSAFGSTQSGSQVGTGSHTLDPGPKDRSPEAMAVMLKGLIMKIVKSNTWDEVGGQGTIQYFPMGMAMVVNQTQEVQEEIIALLASLRKLQDLQVTVELRAVLVSETFFERIGMDFDMNIRTPTSRREPDLLGGTFVPSPFANRTADKLGGLISGLTGAGTLTPDLNIPIRNSTFNFTTPQFGGYQPEAGLTLGLAFLSDIQVFMFLEAVQGDRRAHIMQAPKITVYNGQVANISATTTRPTVTNVVPIMAPNGQVVMQPQFGAMPFGLGMTVTPVVSPDRRFIRLNLNPQIGAALQDPAAAALVAIPSPFQGVFNGGFPQVPLPNTPLQVITVNPQGIQLTIVQTTVNVPDGGTVLLGGFKFLAEERTEYGPPILSKIPYLSRLFRNVGWSRDGSTLLYLVTARIIMVEEEENIFLGNQPAIPR